MPKCFVSETRDLALGLYQSGKRAHAVCASLKVSRTTLYRWLQDAGVVKRREPVDIEDIRRLRKAGLSQNKIAHELGVTRMHVRTALGAPKYECACILFECGKKFWSKSISHFCCARHKNRHEGRKGQNVAWVECGLPECRTKLLSVGGAKRWCGRIHHALHRRRLLKWGFYSRILGACPQEKCLACGESIILDKHHVKYKRKSMPGPEVWLCPTHHMAVHRGLAKVENGVYTSLVPAIFAGLATKWPDAVAEIKNGAYRRTAPSGSSYMKVGCVVKGV